MGATEMVRVRCFLCMTLLILLSAAAAAAGTMDVGYVQPSNATMFHGVAGGGVEWLETEMTVSSCASKTHITNCALNPDRAAAGGAKSGQPYRRGCPPTPYCSVAEIDKDFEITSSSCKQGDKRKGAAWAMATELGRVHCLCVAVLLLLVAAAAGGGRDVGEARLHQLNGTIGQMHAVEEWSLGSETARRILQSTQNSISYGALQKDRVPLQASQPGNAYTRGCQAVYHCKS
ncbi:hypothetical protein BHM03_00001399 [Ensete ventricosum]|nr:hypothetical protein BHM03_00001399 [Ensete ventricosum]